MRPEPCVVVVANATRWELLTPDTLVQTCNRSEVSHAGEKGEGRHNERLSVFFCAMRGLVACKSSSNQHHVTCNSQTTVVEVEMRYFLRFVIDQDNEIAGAPKLKDSAHTPWRQHVPEEPSSGIHNE
eukprot:982125-Amphidinium_carterae.2